MLDPYRLIRMELKDLAARFENNPTSEQARKLALEMERLCSILDEERRQTIGSLRRLERTQRILDADIRAIENSLIFSFLRWLGRPLLGWKAKATQLLPPSKPPGKDDRYSSWVDRENASGPSPEWYRRRAGEFRARPVFSVLLPISAPSREWLEQAIQSVRNQTYPLWELRVCDGSGEGWVRDRLADAAQAEPSIRVVHSPGRLSTVRALNCALSSAKGDYFVFLDPDDLLPPDALHHVAESLQEDAADLIYADEDLVDRKGVRVQPVFKPDWSPNLLLSCMYLGRPLAVSRHAMERAGEFRPEFDGAEYYDLVLRLTDQATEVRHISRVLYHRRMHLATGADNAAAEPGSHAAGRHALEDTLQRRGWKASIEDGAGPNLYRIRWHMAGQPLISLVICSRSAKLLDRCLRAIRDHTDYPHRQIVVVQHMVDHRDAMERVLSRHEVERAPYVGPFNFSRMSNLGSEAADGEILVFLNDDVEPLVSSWLGDLAAQARRPEVGIAGAKLLYPSGTFQHAGVAIGIQDGCAHPGRGMYGASYWPWIGLTRDVSAVTGACMAMRKEVFRQLGGFDDLFPVNYNDTDLCMRARKAGYQVVFESGAVLRHFECQTRMRGKVGFAERERWYRRWSSELERGDPFYSPHLTHVSEDLSLNLEESSAEELSFRDMAQ